MRGGRNRSRQHGDEEESVFVSMTDMTIGFLFIVILLLAFFANRYNPDDNVPRPRYDSVVRERDQALLRVEDLERQLEEARAQLEILQAELDATKAENIELKKRIEELEEKLRKLEAELLSKATPLEAYVRSSDNVREAILTQLKHDLEIEFPDLKIILSEESDALRFQGDGLFRRGEHELRRERVELVQTVAMRLDALLPCYTLGARSNWESSCNAAHALIESIQIEGHTDADGGDLYNLNLSTNRANSTFAEMTARVPDLVKHLNFNNQPVLSVAGYGKMRPVSDNETADGKATNRRIDLRIIMYVPSKSEEIGNVRDALMGHLDD